MPNWTTNYVTIEGDAIALKQIKRKLRGGEREFDFERLAPMPAELRDVVLPLDIVETSAEADAINEQWAKESGSYLAGTVRAIAREQEKRWKKRYGASNWRDWAGNNWGVKWNADDIVLETGPRLLCYTFDTAWCAPYPIAQRLRELCIEAGLTLTWEAHDEDSATEDERYVVMASDEMLRAA